MLSCSYEVYTHIKAVEHCRLILTTGLYITVNMLYNFLCDVDQVCNLFFTF